VLDGDTGFLVPSGDWQRMADRTQQLLDDAEGARAMGVNARRIVARMMNPAALLRHEQDTYRDLLARWPVGRVATRLGSNPVL
jgi:glycosyltransferase involved in cell wall biosynthesis